MLKKTPHAAQKPSKQSPHPKMTSMRRIDLIGPLSSAWSPAESEFLAELEDIEIYPNFSSGRISFMQVGSPQSPHATFVFQHRVSIRERLDHFAQSAKSLSHSSSRCSSRVKRNAGSGVRAGCALVCWALQCTLDPCTGARAQRTFSNY